MDSNVQMLAEQRMLKVLEECEILINGREEHNVERLPLAKSNPPTPTAEHPPADSVFGENVRSVRSVPSSPRGSKVIVSCLYHRDRFRAIWSSFNAWAQLGHVTSI